MTEKCIEDMTVSIEDELQCIVLNEEIISEHITNNGSAVDCQFTNSDGNKLTELLSANERDNLMKPLKWRRLISLYT